MKLGCVILHNMEVIARQIPGMNGRTKIVGLNLSEAIERLRTEKWYTLGACSPPGWSTHLFVSKQIQQPSVINWIFQTKVNSTARVKGCNMADSVADVITDMSLDGALVILRTNGWTDYGDITLAPGFVYRILTRNTLLSTDLRIVQRPSHLKLDGRN